MFKFLKFLFSKSKPVDSDGLELTFPNEPVIPSKPLIFDDREYITHDASKLVLPQASTADVYRETNFAYDAKDAMIRDAAISAKPADTAGPVKAKRRALTAAQKERKNAKARQRRAQKRDLAEPSREDRL